MAYWGGFRPYVPVAQRRAKARKELEKLRKKGAEIQPVELSGRTIARSFWGGATTWNRSRISRTACRADALTCATARSATWKSRPAASKPW